MEIAAQVEAENELKGLGAAQLRQERQEISRKLKSLQDQIGDIAFNNYRTYAAAGRTTQDCTDSFTEMSEKLREVSGEVSSLQDDLKTFHSSSKNVETELSVLQAACNKDSLLWEVLSLPARMDVCIRSGYYEAAYSLTNYGMLMQQHSMVKNPLMKMISDRLVQARSLLLEELFNKFSGPLDLAASLQVVNNVRKMPYLTATQLRVSVLQHKDLYLEKQLLDIASHPDFAIAAIDIYRTCMHDTLVLYLSVFPENESVKKDPTIDPRWEPWPTSSPWVILGQWGNRNIARLLDLIHRTEMKSGVDMASVWSKMMSLASTFGRMGLDFRPLIVKSLTSLIIERFKTAVKQATTKLVSNVKVLSIVSGEIGGLPNSDSSSDAPHPAPEISMWDDMCVYANDLINALNGMRYSHTTLILSSVVNIMRESMITVLSWLSSFNASPLFSKAVRIVCVHLAPFLSQSIRYLFPFVIVSRLFGSSVTKHQFEAFTELDARDLAASCDGSEKIEEVLLPMLQKKTLADIDMDALRRSENFTTPFDHKEATDNKEAKPTARPTFSLSDDNEDVNPDDSVTTAVHLETMSVTSQEEEDVTQNEDQESADMASEREVEMNEHDCETSTTQAASSVTSEVNNAVAEPIDEASTGVQETFSVTSEVEEAIPRHQEQFEPSAAINMPHSVEMEEISLSSPVQQPRLPTEDKPATTTDGWGEEESAWGWDEANAAPTEDIPEKSSGKKD